MRGVEGKAEARNIDDVEDHFKKSWHCDPWFWMNNSWRSIVEVKTWLFRTAVVLYQS
jgi:hypothetical protein